VYLEKKEIEAPRFWAFLVEQIGLPACTDFTGYALVGRPTSVVISPEGGLTMSKSIIKLMFCGV